MSIDAMMAQAREMESLRTQIQLDRDDPPPDKMIDSSAPPPPKKTGPEMSGGAWFFCLLFWAWVLTCPYGYYVNKDFVKRANYGRFTKADRVFCIVMSPGWPIPMAIDYIHEHANESAE